MEPVSVIAAALAAGGTDVTKQAMADAYSGLKEALLRRPKSRWKRGSGPDPAKVSAALEEFERARAAAEAELGRQLEQAGVKLDEETVRKAQALLVGAGTVIGSVQANHNGVVITGDHTNGEFTIHRVN
jgi:hypothetical protein